MPELRCAASRPVEECFVGVAVRRRRVPLEYGDRKSAARKRQRCAHAGDAAADDGDVFCHGGILLKTRSTDNQHVRELAGDVTRLVLVERDLPLTLQMV